MADKGKKHKVGFRELKKLRSQNSKYYRPNAENLVDGVYPPFTGPLVINPRSEDAAKVSDLPFVTIQQPEGIWVKDKAEPSQIVMPLTPSGAYNPEESDYVSPNNTGLTGRNLAYARGSRVVPARPMKGVPNVLPPTIDPKYGPATNLDGTPVETKGPEFYRQKPTNQLIQEANPFRDGLTKLVSTLSKLPTSNVGLVSKGLDMAGIPNPIPAITRPISNLSANATEKIGQGIGNAINELRQPWPQQNLRSPTRKGATEAAQQKRNQLVQPLSIARPPQTIVLPTPKGPSIRLANEGEKAVREAFWEAGRDILRNWTGTPPEKTLTGTPEVLPPQNILDNPANQVTDPSVATPKLQGWSYTGPGGYADQRWRFSGAGQGAPVITDKPAVTTPQVVTDPVTGRVSIQEQPTTWWSNRLGYDTAQTITDRPAQTVTPVVGTNIGGTLVDDVKPNWIPPNATITETGGYDVPATDKYPGGVVVEKVDNGWIIKDKTKPLDDPIIVPDAATQAEIDSLIAQGNADLDAAQNPVGGNNIITDPITGVGGNTGVGTGSNLGGVGDSAYSLPIGGAGTGGSGFIVINDPEKGPSTLEQFMGMRYDRDFMEGGDLAGNLGRTPSGGRGSTTGPSTYEEWLNFRRDPDVKYEGTGERIFEDLISGIEKSTGPTRFAEGQQYGEKGSLVRTLGTFYDWLRGWSDENFKMWEDKGIPSELSGRNPFGPDYANALKNIKDILKNPSNIKTQEYGDLQIPGLLYAAGLISQYGSQAGIPLAALNLSNDIMSSVNNIFAEHPEMAGNPIQDAVHMAFWVPGKVAKEAWNNTLGKVLPKIQDSTIADKFKNATLGELRNPPKPQPNVRVSIKGKEVGLGQPLTRPTGGITGNVTPLPKPPRTTAPLGMPPAGRGTTPEGRSKTRPTRGQGQLNPLSGDPAYSGNEVEYKGDPISSKGKDEEGSVTGKFKRPITGTPVTQSDESQRDDKGPDTTDITTPNNTIIIDLPVDESNRPINDDMGPLGDRLNEIAGFRPFLLDAGDYAGMRDLVGTRNADAFGKDMGQANSQYGAGATASELLNSYAMLRQNWDINQLQNINPVEFNRPDFSTTDLVNPINTQEPAEPFNPLDDNTNVWGGAGDTTTTKPELPRPQDLTSSDVEFIARGQFIGGDAAVYFYHPQLGTQVVTVPAEYVPSGNQWRVNYDLDTAAYNAFGGNAFEWRANNPPRDQGVIVDVSKHTRSD